MFNYMKNMLYSLIDGDEESKLSRVTVTRLVGKKINTFKFQLIEYNNEFLFPNSQLIEPESLYQRLKVKIKRYTPEAEEETITFVYKMEIHFSKNTPFTKIINYHNGITKEGRFYKKIKESTKNIPSCIPKMLEATTTHIILENDYDGYEICRAKWYGIKHFQIVLDTIAEYHAFSFHLKKLHEKRRMRPFIDANRFLNDEIFYNKKCAITRRLQRQEFHSHMFLIDQLNETEMLRNDIKLKFRRKYDGFYYDLKTVNHALNVFTYCDPWGRDNFLFKYEYDSVKYCRLLDFKFLRYLPPSHDVLSVIYSNSTMKFRKECGASLLNYYYDQLSDRLRAYKYDPTDIYPREAYDKACRDRLLTVLFYNVNYKVIALLSQKKYNEHFSSNSDIIDFLLDNRVNHLEELMGNDECYRINLMEEYKEFLHELME